MDFIQKERWEQTQTQQDLAEILWQLSEENYFNGSPWSKAVFNANLKRNCYLFLVDEKKKIQGYLGYQLLLDEIEIENIVVAASLQKNGYGRRLIAHLFKIASEQQVKTIFLEVRASNQQAYHLYEKMGFKRYYRRKNYYQHPQEDALLMKKEILEAF